MKTYKTKFGIGDTVYYYTQSGIVQDKVVGIVIREDSTEYSVNKGGIFNKSECELFTSEAEALDLLRKAFVNEFHAKLKALDEMRKKSYTEWGVNENTVF